MKLVETFDGASIGFPARGRESYSLHTNSILITQRLTPSQLSILHSFIITQVPEEILNE
uniref:Uncharacterized protein n=1 Tax=Tetranychus urticae TaxID=32264 RepID=T1KNS0_TETUR